MNKYKKVLKYLVDSKKKTYVDTYTISPSDMLKDKIAIITGATSGIGLAISETFSRQGIKVIMIGRNEEKLKQAQTKVKNSEIYVLDMKNLNKYDEFFDYILNKYKKIDILVNNAGISLHEDSYEDVSEKGFDEQFITNLKAPYFFTQTFLKKTNKELHKGLNILFISSERGSQIDTLPYGLTKVAINSLVKGLSEKYLKDGVRVNGIAPGVTTSNITKIKEGGNMSTPNYVSKRFFLASEVAEVALFLVSDYSKCISGEIIHTNDGNSNNSYGII